MIAVHWIDRSANEIGVFKTDSRLLRRVAGRALLSDTLASTGMESATVVRTPGRRPYLKEHGRHFSMAHSGNLTVCVVAEENVAVDLELLGNARERRLQGRLPTRFFTSGELQEIAKAPNRLVPIFTLKEAWAKHQGAGLAIGLGGFDEAAVLKENPGVAFSPVRLPGAACVVCHANGARLAVRQRVLSAEQLIEARRIDRKERTP